MDTIIQQETANRAVSGTNGTPTQSRSIKYQSRSENYGERLDAQIEKANAYSETLNR